MISTWHSLDTEADAVAVVTVSAEAKTCALLERAIATLADGFTSAEIKESDAASVRMGLFSQNLNSLKCSVDIAKRGYYTQSMGLVRGVYENWIAFHYIEGYPTRAELWLSHDKRPPMHSAMLKALGPSFVEDRTDAREWYGTLCRFAHTDALVVLAHLGHCDGEPCTFFGAKYRPDLFRTCAYTIALFTSIMLREVSLFVSASPWQQSYATTVGELLRFIEQENDDFKTVSA